MILTCANHNGPDRDAVYRMRFFDIARDSLQWTWERSTDGASTFDGALAAPVRAGVK